jgi:FtsZ-interacting cell division protein YlmF
MRLDEDLSMQDKEMKVGWLNKAIANLGWGNQPEPEMPEDDDGIIIPGKNPRVLHFPTDTKTQIAVLTPANLNAIKVPADFLKNGRAVLVNFHGLDKKVADNARFFLSGITYAIGGSLQKITDTIYVFTPCEVGIICPNSCDEEEEEDEEPPVEFKHRIFA